MTSLQGLTPGLFKRSCEEFGFIHNLIQIVYSYTFASSQDLSASEILP
jgi:hypothetical protein